MKLILVSLAIFSSSHFKANATVGTKYHGVLATKHAAKESGACQLPEGNYVDGIHPVALGNIPSLHSLKHRPGLCGHILRIDCGKGAKDIIVTNANLGGGLDLYGSAWDLATGHMPPGQAYCSMQLTKRNMLKDNGPRCYYAPESEKHNPYFHLLSLFNTGGKILKSATLDGRRGNFNSITAYFAFHGGPVNKDSAKVLFEFEDGSNHAVNLRECAKEGKMRIWS